MKILSKGDSVGIVACSNGLNENMKEKISELIKALDEMGLTAYMSENIYRKRSVFNGTGKEKADALMKFYRDKNIKAIFDVSGGDLANEVLEYLNFNEIKENNKPYFGYSDLTVVINSLYSRADKKSYLYQIRNLVDSCSSEQTRNFKDTFIDGNDSIFKFNYKWIQGNCMEGIVVGGNIRCLLKLSGTEYMPDFQGKILFLESFSGDVPKMVTYLIQYKQLGVFNKINGIILGSYTEMEQKNYTPSITELVKSIVNDDNMPIVKTEEIGHGKDSKCIIIGEKISLKRKC
ncbi:S66 peptidase family protein [uncultured Clostridium sp.]|uniref:S66 family peptidase n=1 Tax=uncultured Clostridium sp. TaxID=59620 RepID=UPI0025FCAB63|nr:S66 peptidase family protein [uncultured Clostridium sp.]